MLLYIMVDYAYQLFAALLEIRVYSSLNDIQAWSFGLLWPMNVMSQRAATPSSWIQNKKDMQSRAADATVYLSQHTT